MREDGPQFIFMDFEGGSYNLTGMVSSVITAPAGVPLPEAQEAGTLVERNLLVQLQAHREEIKRLQKIIIDHNIKDK